MEASKRADKSSSVWGRGDSLVTLSCKIKEKLDYRIYNKISQTVAELCAFVLMPCTENNRVLQISNQVVKAEASSTVQYFQKYIS